MKRCEVARVSENESTFVVYFPKNRKYDSLVQAIDNATKISRERGFIDHITKKYLGSFDVCQVANFKEIPLPMNPLLGIVFLGIFGCDLGLVSFAVETCFHVWYPYLFDIHTNVSVP